jgi:hypothetical protein
MVKPGQEKFVPIRRQAEPPFSPALRNVVIELPPDSEAGGIFLGDGRSLHDVTVRNAGVALVTDGDTQIENFTAEEVDQGIKNLRGKTTGNVRLSGRKRRK